MPRVRSNRGREMTLLLTGVTFAETVSVLDDDDQPINITGATFAASIRRFPSDSGAALATITAAINGAAVNGSVALSMTAAATAALTFDRAKWSLRMTLGGVVSQVYYGDVYFTPDATR